MFQEVADSLTENDFKENLLKLENSSQWKVNARLRNYVKHQWLGEDKFRVIWQIND